MWAAGGLLVMSSTKSDLNQFCWRNYWFVALRDQLELRHYDCPGYSIVYIVAY